MAKMYAEPSQNNSCNSQNLAQCKWQMAKIILTAAPICNGIHGYSYIFTSGTTVTTFVTVVVVVIIVVVPGLFLVGHQMVTSHALAINFIIFIVRSNACPLK